MTEHRTRDDGILMPQTINHLIDITHGIEAQTMHAGVELDMYGPAGDTLLTGCLDKCVHQTERIDLRLEIVVEHGLEGGHLGIHDHDVGGDAGLTERHTLVGHSHGEIVYTMILQRLGYLYGTRTIAVSLDHTHHLRLRLQERTVVVQVVDHGIEIHLKDGLVHLLFQLFRNLVEAERTGTLQQDQLIPKAAEYIAGEEMRHIGKKLLVGHLDLVCLGRQLRTDADELLDAALHSQFVHLGIKHLGRRARLEDITEDQCLFRSLTTVHEVEGDVKGVDVTVVRVVDEDTAALPLLHLQTHRYRLQLRHTFVQLCRCQT